MRNIYLQLFIWLTPLIMLYCIRSMQSTLYTEDKELNGMYIEQNYQIEDKNCIVSDIACFPTLPVAEQAESTGNTSVLSLFESHRNAIAQQLESIKEAWGEMTRCKNAGIKLQYQLCNTSSALLHTNPPSAYYIFTLHRIIV